MEATKPELTVGKLVTIVSMYRDEVWVSSARTLLVKDDILAFKCSPAGDPESMASSAATVLFDTEGSTWVIRGRFTHWPTSDRCLLIPTGPIRPGERREFIRADICGLPVQFTLHEDRNLSEQQIDDWQRSFSSDCSRWPTLDIDLSASGARFIHRDPCAKGSVAMFSICLAPSPDADSVLHLPSRVIRCRPTGPDPDDMRFDVAIEFMALPEASRDRLVHCVFAARASAIGLPSSMLSVD